MKISRYFAVLFIGSVSLFTLAGCGGGDGGGTSSKSSAVSAPTALSYASPTSVVAGVAIASLSPTVTGSVASYAVSPALPAGMTIDTSSGMISGTPTAATAQGSYTITAANAGGSTTFALTLTVNAAVTVSGTAATGAAIAGATVTLKDAAGKTQTATTAADGSFQVIVNGLTSPFLLSISGTGGTTLYSYASQSGTANLSPYTSVVLQAYYKAQGTDVASVFGGALSSASFPNSQQLALLVHPITVILQPYLSNAGVTTPDQFSPFSTSFTANHTGFDQVLDRTTVNSSLLAFSVDNGSGSTAGTISSAVTESVTAASSGTLAELAVNATTTNSTTSISSTSQQTVPVGTSNAQQTALAAAQTGALTLLNDLAALVTKYGTAITSSEVSAYVDAGFLDEGKNASAFTQEVSTFLSSIPSGATFTPSIYRVNKFDPTAATLDATLDLKVISGSTTTDAYIDDNDDPNYGMVIKQESDGSWKFYGHQTSAKAHVNVTKTLFYDANGSAPNSPTDNLDMQAQVSVLQGTLSGAGVTGPGNSLPDCSLSPSPLTQSSVALSHDAGVYNGNQDRYDLACSLVDAGALSGTPPPAGTAYVFALTLASGGGTVQQGFALNGVTNDSGDLTQINGVSRAAFTAGNSVANVVGMTLTLGFTLPTTYAVLYSNLAAFCQNAGEVSSGGGTDINGTSSEIAPGINSGTIQIPAQCDGAPTASVSVSVNFIGVNGERSQVTQNIHN